jgi:hypothetical protein
MHTRREYWTLKRVVCKSKVRINFITLSDFEDFLFKIGTSAKLSVWNIICLLQNWCLNKTIDKTIESSSRKVMCVIISDRFQLAGHWKNVQCVEKYTPQPWSLQSVTGLLNVCARTHARAIPAVKAFNRRFIEAMQGVCKPNLFIRFSVGMKDDIRMWLSYLEKFNRSCRQLGRKDFNYPFQCIYLQTQKCDDTWGANGIFYC